MTVEEWVTPCAWGRPVANQHMAMALLSAPCRVHSSGKGALWSCEACLGSYEDFRRVEAMRQDDKRTVTVAGWFWTKIAFGFRNIYGTCFPNIINRPEKMKSFAAAFFCVHECFLFCFLAQSLYPAPTHPPELSTCSISMSLSRFCLIVHFVH